MRAAILAVGVFVLAQAAGDGLPATSPLHFDLGNMTATAILGWYAWHTASRTIPNLVNDFRAEMQLERKTHGDERAQLFSELKEERNQRIEDTKEFLQTIRGLKCSAAA